MKNLKLHATHETGFKTKWVEFCLSDLRYNYFCTVSVLRNLSRPRIVRYTMVNTLQIKTNGTEPKTVVIICSDKSS